MTRRDPQGEDVQDVPVDHDAGPFAGQDLVFKVAVRALVPDLAAARVVFHTIRSGQSTADARKVELLLPEPILRSLARSLPTVLEELDARLEFEDGPGTGTRH